MRIRHLSAEDLDHVLSHTAHVWPQLRGGRLFITGGTGFFGTWLLESFLWAVERHRLRASAVVLTRDPDAFAARLPHVATHPAIECWGGDVRSFAFPASRFSHIIHAATYTGTPSSHPNPRQIFDTIVDGTRRVLELAEHCGAGTLLFTSSGAVYGRQPASLAHVTEDYDGAPDPCDPRAAYGEAKRAAELLCAMQSGAGGPHVKIARCFAFVGPHLPLDLNYAVGNFIRDGLGGGPIRVTGDGRSYRSYLYAADLAAWLWTILACGAPLRPYNVGGDTPVTIADLATVVASTFDPPVLVERTHHEQSTRPPGRYVPAIDRAGTELGLRPHVSLVDALRRTVDWHRSHDAPEPVA